MYFTENMGDNINNWTKKGTTFREIKIIDNNTGNDMMIFEIRIKKLLTALVISVAATSSLCYLYCVMCIILLNLEITIINSHVNSNYEPKHKEERKYEHSLA
uniref:Uncharacterized protein n=1 Tax=Glossina brevipalpis TaxID=37001 RepID=A0A1A9WX93_9MUSC